MRQHAALLLLGLLSGACTIPETIESLDDRSPPPEFGRPMWVRVPAGVGAWLGAIVGGVASLALAPVTVPISLLAKDDLGENGKSELIFFPAMAGASIGHAVLGTPPDIVDYVFRRAWTDSSPPLTHYEFVPMQAAGQPQSAPPAPPANPKK